MNVAELVVALVVDATNFVTACASSAQAYKTATLLKTLNVNAIIGGEVGVGKKTLARYILNDAPLIKGSDYNEVLTALQNSKEIIITDFENIPNIKKVLDLIRKNSVRLIATAKSSFYNEYIDDIFSVKFDIPPLSQRSKDVEVLIKKYLQEASELFSIDAKIDTDNFEPDLTQNSNSLRRQIMIYSLLQDISEKELMSILENYMKKRLGTNSDYRNLLYLYEVPLIRAGLNKYKSQLKLSSKLGLNRNTLRKKIAENSEYL